MRYVAFALLLPLIACQPRTPVDDPVPSDQASTGERTSSPSTESGGTRVDVPSDPRASYWILGKKPMSGGHLEVLTRRVGPSGESFSRREIDCDAGTARYIGEGDTLAEAQVDAPAPGEMSVPVAESITGVITSAACS